MHRPPRVRAQAVARVAMGPCTLCGAHCAWQSEQHCRALPGGQRRALSNTVEVVSQTSYNRPAQPAGRRGGGATSSNAAKLQSWVSAPAAAAQHELQQSAARHGAVCGSPAGRGSWPRYIPWPGTSAKMSATPSAVGMSESYLRRGGNRRVRSGAQTAWQ